MRLFRTGGDGEHFLLEFSSESARRAVEIMTAMLDGDTELIDHTLSEMAASEDADEVLKGLVAFAYSHLTMAARANTEMASQLLQVWGQAFSSD